MLVQADMAGLAQAGPNHPHSSFSSHQAITATFITRPFHVLLGLNELRCAFAACSGSTGVKLDPGACHLKGAKKGSSIHIAYIFLPSRNKFPFSKEAS